MIGKRLIFKRLTSSDFNGINGAYRQEGGGGQTYIDFSRNAVPDDFLHKMFGQGKTCQHGYEWYFEINSMLGNEKKVQKALLQSRNHNSNALRDQSAHPIYIWDSEVCNDFPKDYNPSIDSITVYILECENNGEREYWAGWFKQTELNQQPIDFSMSVLPCGCIEFTEMQPIIDISNRVWPFNNKKKLVANTEIIKFGQFDIKHSSLLPYLTAIKTKPFLLLAGISGTGKSRIVRELSRSCWNSEKEDERAEYEAHKPKNFEMIQVKPNWHDSSELIGYVSRINGEKFVVGPFLKFMVKAMQDPERPYFLCLDEMNLAPVEQYFAEYLSVLESRKLENGKIVTDPIIEYEVTEAYNSLIDQLITTDDKEEYKNGKKRLTIPQNLIVVGTVNMDETTYGFSRKVLDRAMTIEMNEVNLRGGLDEETLQMPYIEPDVFIPDAVEGKDVYGAKKEVCNKVLTYLEKINEVLENSPFKIAYRTRNEFLVYVVNALRMAPKEEEENVTIAKALDQITSMKVLSRIEGDKKRVGDRLERLMTVVNNMITEYNVENYVSISITKLENMQAKLNGGYTDFWD